MGKLPPFKPLTGNGKTILFLDQPYKDKHQKDTPQATDREQRNSPFKLPNANNLPFQAEPQGKK